MRYSYSLSVFLLIIIFSCSKDDVTPVNESLLSSEKILTRPGSELQGYITLSGLNLPVSELKNDVALYKVTYKTTYLNNQVITASGLVILPSTNGSYPMISFQHGTIAAHSEAPTALPTNSLELILYASLASPGFIAVVPDYIGFGSSSGVMHPYYDEDLTASAVIDLLKAAKELARGNGITFNKKLFLAGYSQGGYATMAAHKAIEKNGLSGFNLIASFPASGGYDVKGMQSYVFNLDTYADPFFLGYVAMSYKTSYNWTHPLSEFFQEPYATRIPTLFDGSKNGDEIDAQLTVNIKDLVTADLLSNIDTDAKYQYLADAFKKNSLTNWTPAIKMFMYHGDSDTTVPYQNSVDTYIKLISNGASSSTVSLTTFPGKTHGSGVGPYIEAFIPIMISLK